MPFFYSVYGLQLQSNAAIPGLVPSQTLSEVDVQVELGLMPPWFKQDIDLDAQIWNKRSHKDEREQPLARVWTLRNGDYWRLDYCDRTEFIIDRTGTEIWATWPDTLTLEDTATYLLGPILGFVLRLRGVTCLHASAVAVGEWCMAILGPAGAGKSTTAAAFAKAGFPVLSDDVLPLLVQEQSFWVQPGYPLLRLWPPSVTALYGQPDVLPCLTPNWDKRYLDLSQSGYYFHDSPLPLGVIYILGDRINSPTAPLIEAVPPHNALMNLIPNTYANTLLDKAMRAQEFDLLSRVVASVPVRRVTAHTSTQYLPQLCDAILEDFQAL